MISRLFIVPKGEDSRTRLFLKSWSNAGLKNKVSAVSLVDSYILDTELDYEQIIKSANALTNPILEKFLINELPKEKKFSHIIEIGFLPGVTDNVAHTAKETIRDLLHLGEDFKLDVYTSKVF